MTPEIIKHLLLCAGIIGLLWAFVVDQKRRAASAAPTPDALKAELHEVSERVSRIEQEVDGVRDALDEKASSADLSAIERKIDEHAVTMQRVAEAIPDIESRQRAESDKLAELSTDLAVCKAGVESIERSMDRIMAVIVPKGMTK